VVRHFGGTKLGIPGLIEAYGGATTEAVQQSQQVRNQRSIDIRIDAPMKYQPHLLASAKRGNFPVKDLTYTSRFEMTIGVPADDSDTHIYHFLLHLSDRAYDELDDLKDYLDIQLTELGIRFTERS
jgi:putative IMPACT (imprinted ancient) family translation regulator